MTSQSAPLAADLPETPARQDGPSRGRSLLNATAVMASGTMISRLLGLVRAILIAFILGNGTMRAGVLSLALTVPSSLYMLLAGGTLNNVLVPQIVRAVKHDSDGGKAFVDRIMTGFLIILGVLTVVFTVGAPVVMSIYTKSVWRTPEMADQWRSLLLMSYITMPQVFFYGVFFLIGQVLNAREKFGPMMWAPILNNVVAIISLGGYLWIWGTQSASGQAFTDQQVWVLGAGSTVGIITQTVILIPYLKRAGFTYRPRFDLKGTGLGQTFHIARWMVGYVALTSVAQVVVTNLASGAATVGSNAGGAWNAYQNAYLIWILPHSLLTVSLATAMLPTASAHAQDGDLGGVAVETNRALRLALTFLVPAAVAFVVLADPITRIPFGNGVGASDYHFVAWALMAFGVGLVPFTIQYLYLRAFYALDNTKTPFLIQIWISGANAGLAVLFAFASSDPATLAARLALSYSLAYLLGAFLTFWALHKRLPDLDGRQTWWQLLKLLGASAPAAGLAWVITWPFSGFPSVLIRLVGLILAGLVAVLVFFFAAKRLGIPEAASLLEVIRRRGGNEGDGDATELIIEEVAEVAHSEEGSLSDPDVAADDEPNLELTNDDPDGVGVFISVSEPLDYPAPESASLAGQILADRYELAEQLAVHDGNQTWLALDSVLSRPVLVHLLSAGPGTKQALDAARNAAVATDSRFLRVLDVVDDSAGAYLVYEYEAGQTLEKLLRSGPLTTAEASWIVREIADALVPLHAAGHAHGHLTLASVLISGNGNLKVLGFGVDAALHRVDQRPASELADVRALGDLLYAGVTATWPHGEHYGLPAAPQDDAGTVLPSQLVADVPIAVDHLIDRIRSARPNGGASRLTTSQALTTELSVLLGAGSSASDLRARLDPTSDTLNEPTGPVSLVTPLRPTPAASRIFSESEEELASSTTFVEEALSLGENFTPVPRPVSTRKAVPLLLLTSVLVIVVGLVAALVLTNRPVLSETAPALTVASVSIFDPKADGGDGRELPDDPKVTIDGDPATAWHTEQYKAATKPNGKPGVGLLLDLGVSRQVDLVKLNLVGQGTTVEIRVPKPASDVASVKTVKDWDVAASAADAGDVAEIALPAGQRTRYLLVYLTKLPAVDAKYQAAIAEITVLGR
jgi:putative peptidoglycan lipid II flippase